MRNSSEQTSTSVADVDPLDGQFGSFLHPRVLTFGYLGYPFAAPADAPVDVALRTAVHARLQSAVASAFAGHAAHERRAALLIIQREVTLCWAERFRRSQLHLKWGTVKASVSGSSIGKLCD